MILVDMFLPESTAIKRPAIEMLATARTRATMTGMRGVEPHTFPTKKGTSIGKAPKTKNVAVVLRVSSG
jgi:hypothetical protein